MDDDNDDHGVSLMSQSRFEWCGETCVQLWVDY
jgi:hypothetical protein